MPPRTPLVRPREYVESRSSVLASGLGVFALHVLGVYVFLVGTLRLLLAQVENGPGLADVPGSLVTITVLSVAFGVVVALLVVAAVMHFGCGGSDAGGSFGDALGVAGWAYAPDLIAMPVNYLVLRMRVERLSVRSQGLEQLVTRAQALQEPSGVQVLVSVVVVGWSVYILAKGTAGTHDVDETVAAMPAVVVGVGSLLFRFV